METLDRLETTLRARGGHRLDGSVETHGAKNAALPIMAAALLAKTPVTLHRVPRITDVSVMWSLLEALGARVRSEGARDDHDRRFATWRRTARRTRSCASSPPRSISSARCSGASARPKSRCPAAASSGTRATDMHEAAFRALGADVSNQHGYLIAKSRSGRLTGGAVEFRMPSVGATKNAMLAAVLADGTTTLRNVAMEPEVVDLANFLIAMGARIAGHGAETIVIEGVAELHGVEYEIIPDRIVTGTLLLCGAATRGDVTVKRCVPAHVGALTERLAECGVKVTSGGDWVRVEAEHDHRRHAYRHRPVSRVSDGSAAADGHVSLHRSWDERRRGDDLQRALLLFERVAAHGRDRTRSIGTRP